MVIVITPSVDNAFFYYNSEVLKYTDKQFADITTMGQIGSIMGNQFYSGQCTTLPVHIVLLMSTMCHMFNELL